ncbi:MAG: hypothetical protein IPH44_04265 [Myxococcales bacterium]|nr:hypothetical protein [Myxococcales bacterium]MBK7193832.1 hypothetical protein [Myxococcales bacterium]
MLAADGEAPATDLGPEARQTAASVRELGELVRGSLELSADDAEPRLAGLWDLIERRLDVAEAPAAPVVAPAARPSVGARIWSWLAGHRSHVATGLLSAGAVAGLSMALGPAPTEKVVVKTVAVPAVQPTVMTGSPPSVESMELIGGSGTVFTIGDDDGDGDAAVIWVEPDEVDLTEGI